MRKTKYSSPLLFILIFTSTVLYSFLSSQVRFDNSRNQVVYKKYNNAWKVLSKEDYNLYVQGNLSTDVRRGDVTVPRDVLEAAWEADTATKEFTGAPDFTQAFTQFAQTRFPANTPGVSANTAKNSIKYAVALARGEGLAYGNNKYLDRKLFLGLYFIDNPIEFLAIDFKKLQKCIAPFHDETKSIKKLEVHPDSTNGHRFGSVIKHLGLLQSDIVPN